MSHLSVQPLKTQSVSQGGWSPGTCSASGEGEGGENDLSSLLEVCGLGGIAWDSLFQPPGFVDIRVPAEPSKDREQQKRPVSA